jgi:Xaa-Pro aminopeptidase
MTHILNQIEKNGLVTIYEPEVNINENAAKSHYAPTKETSKNLQKGDSLLIDMWLKLPGESSIYADISWNLYRGNKVPPHITHAFQTVKTARDMAVDFMRTRVKSKEGLFGWEVDKIARDYIKSQGYDKQFTHRLGHSIGTFVHGEQTHLDNYENKDERMILANHITSVEPGIYVSGKFGVRTEINVLVTDNDVIVTTDIQNEIYLLSC